MNKKMLLLAALAIGANSVLPLAASADAMYNDIKQVIVEDALTGKTDQEKHVKNTKKALVNIFFSQRYLEIQYASDECDFCMDEACKTNSFAAKQEIVHNLYDYLDRLEKTYSVEEIRPIRIKIDNEVKKLAARFNVSVEVLKTVPEWVKNWKEHTQSGTAGGLLVASKTQQNLASV